MDLKNNLSCRTVLYWMILTGNSLSYMLKFSQNIVVAGIAKRPPEPPSETQCKVSTNLTSIAPDDPTNSAMNDDFNWSEYEQGLMLSAYYWLHPFMEIPGGILARRYGTKIVSGMGILLAALMGFFLPVATKYHSYANILVRVIQGLAAGVAYPATHDITAKWIPQNERSKFLSAYIGAPIAVAITYAASGYMIYYLKWESVYYVASGLGVLWSVSWWYLVYDSPMQHPRITKAEREYLMEHIAKFGRNDWKDLPVPWKMILTSKSLWANIIANWSSSWGYYTLLSQGPAYFSFIHGWGIQKAGVLAGLPFGLTFLFAYAIGHIFDWLLKSGKLSRTNVRKSATIICNGAPAFMTVGLAYSGCNSNLAVIFMFTGGTVMGAFSSGPLSNYIDLSPNYASVILGVGGLIVNSCGLLSPIIVGLLTNENQTIEQWKLIFMISAVIQWFGCITYLIWGSGEEQPWNTHGNKNADDPATSKIELENY